MTGIKVKSATHLLRMSHPISYGLIMQEILVASFNISFSLSKSWNIRILSKTYPSEGSILHSLKHFK